MTTKTFDFIVVGGGTTGPVVASRLANSASKPSVLLLEAGGPNSEPEGRIAGERHTYWITGGLSLDYGYKTIPQPALNGRELPYHRGKGLGGSSATNLGLWDWGAKSEFEEWARIVGDGTWEWANVVQHMKKIENYHDFTPKEYQKYVNPDKSSHGNSGPVDVALSDIWDPTLPIILDAVEQYGEVPLIADISSHDTVGFGVSPATAYDGYRVTAFSAYLTKNQDNLYILTNQQVTQVLFEGKKAVGVEVQSGDKYYAAKEIILSAGAIDTPRILLLSGVGPAFELTDNGIPVVLDQPSIGKHLIDHPILRLAAPIKEGFIGLDSIPSHEGAKEQWLQDRTGPLGEDAAVSAHGYCKLDTSQYRGLQALDPAIQKHLTSPQTPTYEMLSRITPNPEKNGFIWNVSIVMMNNQSTGRVFLKKDDTKGTPGIDLNFLSSEYDTEAIVEAVQKTAKFIQTANIPTGNLAPGPASLDEKDTLEYIRSNLGHLWHAGGTVKMGKDGEAGTCVTPDFRVAGLDGLRVADLSVIPIMTSCHTQSIAYLVGEIAAEKIQAEYMLGNSC